MAPPRKKRKTMASSAASKAAAVMFSTSFRSASKRAWLGFTKDKARAANMAYVSTDGSSTGWHSCVVAAADAPTLLLRARHGDMQGTRNVGAEAAGFALGIETLPAGITRATAPNCPPRSYVPTSVRKSSAAPAMSAVVVAAWQD